MNNPTKYLRQIFTLFTALLILSACQDVVDLDLPESESRLVVEGQITNQPGVNQVKLSKSLAYFDSTATPVVSKATVILSDDRGRSDTLAETPAGSGIYLIETPGTIGNLYTLEITTLEDTRFRSEPELLAAVSAIDSIYFDVTEADKEDEEDEYDVLLDANETANERNFYRWRMAVNGDYRQEPFDLIYANDDFLDGNDVIGFQVNFDPVYAGDSIRVDQMSISENYFDYLDLIWQQTAIIGGIFDTPPAPIIGNITNLDDRNAPAYGFFSASAISSIEAVIEP